MSMCGTVLYRGDDVLITKVNRSVDRRAVPWIEVERCTLFCCSVSGICHPCLGFDMSVVDAHEFKNSYSLGLLQSQSSRWFPIVGGRTYLGANPHGSVPRKGSVGYRKRTRSPARRIKHSVLRLDR